jgi:hypothetical protein
MATVEALGSDEDSDPELSAKPFSKILDSYFELGPRIKVGGLTLMGMR